VLDKYNKKKKLFDTLNEISHEKILKPVELELVESKIFAEEHELVAVEVIGLADITLRDILEVRAGVIKGHHKEKKQKVYFTEGELLYFCNHFLEILADCAKKKIYHSNLSIDNIVITKN